MGKRRSELRAGASAVTKKNAGAKRVMLPQVREIQKDIAIRLVLNPRYHADLIRAGQRHAAAMSPRQRARFTK